MGSPAHALREGRGGLEPLDRVRELDLAHVLAEVHALQRVGGDVDLVLGVGVGVGPGGKGRGRSGSG